MGLDMAGTGLASSQPGYMILIGTALNAAGIIVGGIAAKAMGQSLSASTQARLKSWIGSITVIVGLHLTWKHLNGGFWAISKQFGIVLLSMSLGRLMGSLCGLQRSSNRLGQYAASALDRNSRPGARAFSEAFLACSVLFCVAPLAILGAVQEGVAGDFRAFAIKAAVDGLASMAFVSLFGWSIFLVLLPLIAWQGSITLLVRTLEPWLYQHGLVDSIQATGGMLLFSVALLIFQIRKVPVADYLPSLAIAPALTWLFR